MKSIIKLFWNSEEKRMRVAARILLTIALFLILYKGYLALLTGIGFELYYSSNSPMIIFILGGSVRILPALLTLLIAGKYFDKRSFKDYGFHLNKNWWGGFCFGFILGAVLITIIFIIQLVFGWISIDSNFYVSNSSSNTFIISILVFLFSFFCAGMAEELFSRGYLIKNLSEEIASKKIGSFNSVIIALGSTSILFGVMHFGNPNASLLSVFNIMIAGVMFGTAFIYTGELAIPAGLHLSWNFFQANIFGFPVSGIKYPSETVSIFKIEQHGPEIMTGADFGPEAGLLGLFAMLLGIFFIYYWTLLRNKANFPNDIFKILCTYKSRQEKYDY